MCSFACSSRGSVSSTNLSGSVLTRALQWGTRAHSRAPTGKACSFVSYTRGSSGKRAHSRALAAKVCSFACSSGESLSLTNLPTSVPNGMFQWGKRAPLRTHCFERFLAITYCPERVSETLSTAQRFQIVNNSSLWVLMCQNDHFYGG